MSVTVVSMIGARPQFIKSAIVSRALARAGIAEHVVHSGQHYDHAMSGRFLEELGIAVHSNLNVGSGDHARQTAQIMIGFQECLEALSSAPDAVLVYGDTNSTLAAALVAAKLRIPLVHVEAGLRSFNKNMPEETNRVLTDHVSDLLLCSSEEGRENLVAEGITRGVHVVGDVMSDAFQYFSQSRESSGVLKRVLGANHGEPYILMTLHRPSNTEDPAFLPRLCGVVRRIRQTVVWPVHPRFRAAVEAADLPANIRLVDPVGYFEMVDLLGSCSHVITDSGGLQKEAYWARKLCITLRSETEWVETLGGGWNVLADLDADFPVLLARTPQTEWTALYGDGRACERIAEVLQKSLDRRA